MYLLFDGQGLVTYRIGTAIINKKFWGVIARYKAISLTNSHRLTPDCLGTKPAFCMSGIVAKTYQEIIT